MPPSLCICQICQCGRHYCPHRDESWYVDSSLPCQISEYESRYTGDMACPAQSFKPKLPPYRVPDLEMAKCSTQCIDFVRHPAQRTGNFKPHSDYEEPTENMDLNSTYKIIHDGKQGPTEKSYKPTTRPIGGGQFRSEVTSHDYKVWPITQRQPMVPDCKIQLPDAPFGNKSETQSHYTKLLGKPADSMKPVQTAFISAEPFDSRTSHQTDYTKKDIPAKLLHSKMVYQPPRVPHFMMSTYQTNYRGCPATRAHSFRPPKLNYRYGDVPTGYSTHKTDFIPFPLAERHSHKVQSYEAPDIEMDLHTTQKLEYQGTYGPAADLCVPLERKHGNAMFRSETTHGVDYVPWQGPRREPIIQDQCYEPPKYPFDGQSEFQSRYLGDEAPAADSLRPADHVLESGPFSGDTSYQADYTKKVLRCPAEAQTLNSQFNYQNKRDGHLFYAKR